MNEEREKEALETYEILSTKSAAMLNAARRNDWDVVIAIEEECTQLIVQLKSKPEPIPSNPGARSRKAQIIRRMLIEDAEIRDLAQPQLASLARLMRLTGKRKLVESAYQ